MGMETRTIALMIVMLITTGAANTGSYSFTQGTVEWMITARNSVLFTMKVQGQCWMGFGWHEANSDQNGMDLADYIIGEFNQGGQLTSAWDGYNNQGHSKPEPDASFGGYDNIISFYGEYVDGYSIMTVERYLNTNDTSADHNITNDELNFIWAHGNDGELSLEFHGPNKGKIGMNLFSGAFTTIGPNPTKLLHGAMMILAYGFCFAFGVFISRYLKDHYWWFPLHITIQVLGTVLALSGFIIALLMVSHHFDNLHSWFGITTLSLTFVTPLLGYAADKKYNPNRAAPPVWPDKIHWWTGRLVVVLGWVTIVLGMLKYGAPPVVPAVFSGLPALYIIAFLVVEIYKAYAKRDSTKDGAPLAIYQSSDALLPKKSEHHYS